jgi:predicted transcriptional regulator
MARRPINQPSTTHDLDYEHLQILRHSQRPVSIAEISSELQLPLSVVKILANDLIERNLLIFRSASTPDVQVLQAVINGIRRL